MWLSHISVYVIALAVGVSLLHIYLCAFHLSTMSPSTVCVCVFV